MVAKHLMAASMAVLLAGGGAAEADGRETFMCCEGFLGCHGSEPDLTLTADHGAGTGTVTVRGLPKTETSFKLRGLDRYWVWPQDFRSKGNGFMFRIKPGESGFYYEFDLDDELETNFPSSLYTCGSAG